jgi:hypothetical protein
MPVRIASLDRPTGPPHDRHRRCSQPYPPRAAYTRDPGSLILSCLGYSDRTCSAQSVDGLTVLSGVPMIGPALTPDSPKTRLEWTSGFAGDGQRIIRFVEQSSHVAMAELTDAIEKVNCSMLHQIRPSVPEYDRVSTSWAIPSPWLACCCSRDLTMAAHFPLATMLSAGASPRRPALGPWMWFVNATVIGAGHGGSPTELLCRVVVVFSGRLPRHVAWY